MTLQFGKGAMMGAVDNSVANDRVNFLANKFMEKQVKDPSLQKLLRPSAKCKFLLLIHFSKQSDTRLMGLELQQLCVKDPSFLAPSILPCPNQIAPSSGKNSSATLLPEYSLRIQVVRNGPESLMLLFSGQGSM